MGGGGEVGAGEGGRWGGGWREVGWCSHESGSAIPWGEFHFVTAHLSSGKGCQTTLTFGGRGSNPFQQSGGLLEDGTRAFYYNGLAGTDCKIIDADGVETMRNVMNDIAVPGGETWASSTLSDSQFAGVPSGGGKPYPTARNSRESLQEEVSKAGHAINN